MILNSKPKILLIRREALGDVVMVTPIARRLWQERNGNCEIYIKTLYPDVFKNNPYVFQSFSTENKIEVTYDIVFNLDWTYEKNRDRHVLDAYEDYVFGSRKNSRYCEIFTSNSDEEYVESLLNGLDNFIIVHMRFIDSLDNDQSAKNIHEDIWKNILVEILNKTNLSIIQIGAGSDLSFSANDRLIDYRGKLSIQHIKSLVEKSKCYIGSDSGPSHIAATSQKNSVILYTISPVSKFKPFRAHGESIHVAAQVDCRGCLQDAPVNGKLSCQYDYKCRKSFNTAEIVLSIIKMLK